MTCGLSRAAFPATIGGAVERDKLGDWLLWEEEGRLGSPELSIITGLTLKDTTRQKHFTTALKLPGNTLGKAFETFEFK